MVSVTFSIRCPTPPRISSVANTFERKAASPGKSSAVAATCSSRLWMPAVVACSFWASAFNRSREVLAAMYFGSACGFPVFFLAHAWIETTSRATSNGSRISALRSARGDPLANDLEVVWLRAVSCAATVGHLRKHLERRRIALRAEEGAVLRGAWLDQHAAPALRDFVRRQRRVESRVVVGEQVRQLATVVASRSAAIEAHDGLHVREGRGAHAATGRGAGHGARSASTPALTW